SAGGPPAHPIGSFGSMGSAAAFPRLGGPLLLLQQLLVNFRQLHSVIGGVPKTRPLVVMRKASYSGTELRIFDLIYELRGRLCRRFLVASLRHRGRHLAIPDRCRTLRSFARITGDALHLQGSRNSRDVEEQNNSADKQNGRAAVRPW